MQKAIDGNTKVSELIKANPGAVEALAALSPRFSKLRNPLLRKVLAPRVNVREAAKIGKVDLSKMLGALEGIGFTVQREQKTVSSGYRHQLDQRPKGAATQTLDVREKIERGEDPFSLIMSELKKLGEDEILLLINSFEPVPLFRVLDRKGWAHYVEQEGDVYRVWFQRAKTLQEAEENVKESEDARPHFQSMQEKYADRFEQIDVRGLSMPQPMVNILEAMERLPEDKALWVDHQRVPQYLLPELDARGYQYAYKETDNEELKMIIAKS